MPWTNDSANTTVITNDAIGEDANPLTFADETIPWAEAETTWGHPKTPSTRDAAHSTVITNDLPS